MLLILLFILAGLAVCFWVVAACAIIGQMYNRKPEYAEWNWLNPPYVWNNKDAVRILNERGQKYYQLRKRTLIGFGITCVFMLITMLLLGASGP